MARARNIKPGLFKNELLVEQSLFVRMLFIGLWTLADREGRLEDRPKRIKLELFPYDNEDTDAALSVLDEFKFIKRYEVDGKKVIQIVNFLKHQTPHGTEKDSELPDINGEYTVNERSSNGCVTGKKRTNNVKKNGINVDKELTNGDCIVSKRPDSLNPESLILNPEEKHTAQKSRLVDVEEVFEFWKSTTGHDRAKLDDKRNKLIASALKTGYSTEDLKNAITGCTLSAYHMGDNDKGAKYDSLSLILRDAGKIDQFIGYFNSPPVKQNKPSFQNSRDVRDSAFLTAIGMSSPQRNEKLITGEVV